MTIILPQSQNSQGKRNFVYSLQVLFLKNNARSTKKSCFWESIPQTISFLQYFKHLLKFPVQNKADIKIKVKFKHFCEKTYVIPNGHK